MRITVVVSLFLLYHMVLFGLMFQPGEPEPQTLVKAVNMLLVHACVQGIVIAVLAVKLFDKQILAGD